MVCKNCDCESCKAHRMKKSKNRHLSKIAGTEDEVDCCTKGWIDEYNTRWISFRDSRPGCQVVFDLKKEEYWFSDHGDVIACHECPTCGKNLK